MTFKEKTERAVVGSIIKKLLKYVKKNPDKNMPKLVGFAEMFVGKIFPSDNFRKLKEGASDPENNWTKLAKKFIEDVDENIILKMALAFGLGAGVHGTKTVRENREKHDCNFPWVILMSPTSACNLRCKGCWAAEYDNKKELSYDEMDSVVAQGRELGTHFYMFTGGEPLIRKNDILKLCRKYQDCVFLAYTNSTLIDEKFCEEVKDVGNLTFALSIEGSEESNDARRGDGIHKTVLSKMELMKKHKLLYGISVCYTSQNLEAVTSDKFVDKMIDMGVKFSWYFNYMPVGAHAVPELIPRVEQRKELYHWLRKVRNSKTGKTLFIVDFQNDGEYVGGCIAGGRNYFHVNPAGDIEPCVFIHFADSNIREHTLLQALNNPLFQEYYHNQPFNDNHLRPCPMLENPEKLREMIKKTGAKSTDFLAPEDVETVCARCDKFAAAWKEEAQKLWDSTSHPNPKTQYYRDKKNR